MKPESLFKGAVLCLSMLAAAALADNNVVVVSKTGGDFASPLDAVASISDAAANNPYIVYVTPGVYHLGANPLYLKPWVSLVGAGREATRIVGQVDSAALIPYGGPGLINGADHSEIRQLTVINRYPGTAHAIHNLNASPLISDVVAIARGGGGNGAFKAGIWNDGGSHSTVEHVLARASGAGGAGLCLGIFTRNSVVQVRDSRLVAVDCLINNGVSVDEGGRVVADNTHVIARSGSSAINSGVAVTSESSLQASFELRNGALVGEIYAANVDSSGPAAIVRIAASSVDGSVRAGTSADVKCVGAFDAAFDPLDAACMPIP